jgi:osmotically-inducible protein OsmY
MNSKKQTCGAMRVSRTALVVLCASTVLGACAPIMVGGFVGGAFMASDRRSAANQLADQTIELRAPRAAGEATGDRGHYNFTSYNRVLLITGEAATEADRMAVAQAVGRVADVASVANELGVMEATSIKGRSSDTVITGRVKTALLEAKDLHANAFKVVTERGTVYLMGRVTEREAVRGADLARAVPGVMKVVRVFEILTEAELAGIQPKAEPK